MINKTIGCCDTFLDSISQLYEQTALPFSAPSENTDVQVVLIGLAAADSSTTGTVIVKRLSWPIASGVRMNVSRSVRVEPSLMGPPQHLLNRARRRREDVVGVRADEPDGTHHKDKNKCKHHGIFRDVLRVIIPPGTMKKFDHMPPPGISLSGHPPCGGRPKDEEDRRVATARKIRKVELSLRKMAGAHPERTRFCANRVRVVKRRRPDHP